ncbi:MAG: hypothetical protein D6793_00555 [Thermoflexia bacterium]|nr:MAG: hypothetical protein D6793_00555 [Thermoflexia bacterium]
MDIRARIGNFFFTLGLAWLFLYLISDLTHQPNFNYLFLGVFCALGGWGLMRRYRTPPEPPQRFVRLKRWRAKRREKRANKKDAGGEKKE